MRCKEQRALLNIEYNLECDLPENHDWMHYDLYGDVYWMPGKEQ